ncbi:glycosyl transferase family 90 [Halomonas beimenensis]|uniref:LpsA protein n=1 Tax=Halomonas beimenensis TaxID=475662 RepID=A0A291P297_9GAMM|nr:glycosyl transferase family 90 [Halomonas beimenensis]ATJ81000.1 LpsA protein [Halomonas beimenensis]
MAGREKFRRNLHKFRFYASQAGGLLLPDHWHRGRRRPLLEEFHALPEAERHDILDRVAYYNQLGREFFLPEDAVSVSDFRREKSWAYYLDLKALLRYFPRDLRLSYRFGDVVDLFEFPTFVKSRPISPDNERSILLKLNRVRHYYFVADRLPYDQKKPLLVWRGSCHQPHRRSFIEAFHDHPRCDVGDVHRKSLGQPWHRDVLSVQEQLQYRFILSIEGNDVATNLKWILASNSLCFMTRPRYETWFMEGRLVPGRHYVELADDYSDLEEKLDHYQAHPEEAKRIIRNANRHVARFQDERKERLIGLMVMQKYFELSGQLSDRPRFVPVP